MNVAALLQDSPSEDRRRPQNSTATTSQWPSRSSSRSSWHQSNPYPPPSPYEPPTPTPRLRQPPSTAPALYPTPVPLSPPPPTSPPQRRPNPTPSPMASLRPLDTQIAGGGASIGGSVWGTYPGSSAPTTERERERDRPTVEWQEDRERRKSDAEQNSRREASRRHRSDTVTAATNSNHNTNSPSNHNLITSPRPSTSPRTSKKDPRMDDGLMAIRERERERDREMRDRDRERDYREHLPVSHAHPGRDPRDRERPREFHPYSRGEWDMPPIEREQERKYIRDDRERERERDRDRERDKEDMDIIRAAASSRQYPSQSQVPAHSHTQHPHSQTQTSSSTAPPTRDRDRDRDRERDREPPIPLPMPTPGPPPTSSMAPLSRGPSPPVPHHLSSGGGIPMTGPGMGPGSDFRPPGPLPPPGPGPGTPPGWRKSPTDFRPPGSSTVPPGPGPDYPGRPGLGVGLGVGMPMGIPMSGTLGMGAMGMGGVGFGRVGTPGGEYKPGTGPGTSGVDVSGSKGEREKTERERERERERAMGGSAGVLSDRDRERMEIDRERNRMERERAHSGYAPMIGPPTDRDRDRERERVIAMGSLPERDRERDRAALDRDRRDHERDRERERQDRERERGPINAPHPSHPPHQSQQQHPHHPHMHPHSQPLTHTHQHPHLLQGPPPPGQQQSQQHSLSASGNSGSSGIPHPHSSSSKSHSHSHPLLSPHPHPHSHSHPPLHPSHPHAHGPLPPLHPQQHLPHIQPGLPAQQPPPQRQFQNQFHTQFVHGLQAGSSRMSSPVGEGKSRGAERERMRERESGAAGGSGNVKKGRVSKGKEGERDRERDREREHRERERMDVMMPMGGMPLGPGPGMGMGMGKRWDDVQKGEEEEGMGMVEVDDGMETYVEEEEDIEEETEVRARVCVNLGTYVYPKLPFPYFFDTGDVDMGTVPRVEQPSLKEPQGKVENVLVVDQVKETGNAKEKEKEKAERKEEGEPSKEDRYTVDFETRVTIIIPNAHIPLDRPSKPRIWGGGAVGRSKKVVMRRRPKRRPGGESEARSSGPLPVKKRGRRIYTDDSDLFLCAVHSGWITWSGGVHAREQGQDMKVEVRVLRCVGAGRANGLRGKEEIVGRFLGGWGEKCFNQLPEKGRVVKSRRRDDVDVRGEMTDDEDDDGRGLVSASWGTGHDGSAIEILNVQFTEKSRSIPGLRTRSQRLLEYAERRAGVLGLALSYARGARLAGRKRRRGWDWPPQHFRHLPNASVLDVIPEQDEEIGLVVDESAVDEDLRMNVHTVVFGFGPGGDVQAGYKYDPDVLKRILFPGGEGDRPPPKKRRRIDNATNTESAMDTEVDNIAPSPSYAKTRPVILETAKESYLLSPSTSGAGDGPHKYDIALVLEAEVEEEPVPELNLAATSLPILDSRLGGPGVLENHPSGPDLAGLGVHKSHSERRENISSNPLSVSEASNGEGVNPTAQSTTIPIPPTEAQLSASGHQRDTSINTLPHTTATNTLKATAVEISPLVKALALPEVLPSSRRPSVVYGDASKPLLLQTLQRHLGEEMFRFLKEGIKVADGLSEDGVQTEWMVQVRRWKWGPVTS